MVSFVRRGWISHLSVAILLIFTEKLLWTVAWRPVLIFSTDTIPLNILLSFHQYNFYHTALCKRAPKRKWKMVFNDFKAAITYYYIYNMIVCCLKVCKNCIEILALIYELPVSSLLLAFSQLKLIIFATNVSNYISKECWKLCWNILIVYYNELLDQKPPNRLHVRQFICF